MSDPKKSAVSAATQPVSRAAPPQSGADARKILGEGGLVYSRAIEQLSSDAQKSYTEAYRDYTSGLTAVWSDLQQRSVETYRTLVENLKAAFGQTETVTRCAEAYQNYASILRELLDT